MSTRRKSKRGRNNRKAGNRRNRNREGAEPFTAQAGDLIFIRKPFSQPVPRIRKPVPLMREPKFFDLFSAAAATVSTTTVVTKLSAINQGVGQTQRVGDSLELTSLELRSAAAMTIATDFTNQVRLLVFQWMEDDGTYAPAAADLYSNLGAGLATISTIVHDNSMKIDVLADHLFTLSGVGKALEPFHVLISKFRSRKINFNPAATTGSGNLYYAFVSDSAAIPFPTVTISTRVNFYDD